MEKYSFYTLDVWMETLKPMLETTGLIGFAVAHNYRVVNDALNEYAEKKNDIIKKYGEEKDGMITIVDDEKLAEAEKELSDFAAMEVAVDVMKVPESALADSGLTARQMIEIDWMVEHPKKEEDKAEDTAEKSDKDRFGFDI